MAQEQTQENLDLFKEASRRLETFLAGHDIKLTHTLALEALTVALGDKTYRRFRTLLEKPVVNPPAPVVVQAPNGWKEGEPRWEVHAIYLNNHQRFCDHYGAIDALDAAVSCQVDRITARDSYAVEIASVIDRATGKIADSGYSSDDTIDTHSGALRNFVDVVKDFIVEDDAAESIAAAAVLLDAMLDDRSAARLDHRDPEISSGWWEKRPITVHACGLSFSCDPVEALKVLTSFALEAMKDELRAKVHASDLRDIYHVVALIDYWEPELRHYLPAKAFYDFKVGVKEHTLDAEMEESRSVTWLDVIDAAIWAEAPGLSDVCVDAAGNYFAVE